MSVDTRYIKPNGFNSPNLNRTLPFGGRSKEFSLRERQAIFSECAEALHWYDSWPSYNDNHVARNTKIALQEVFFEYGDSISADSSVRHPLDGASDDEEEAGTPAMRFKLLMDKLERRFPHPEPHRSDEVAEAHYIREIDKTSLSVTRLNTQGTSERQEFLRTALANGECCSMAELRARDVSLAEAMLEWEKYRTLFKQYEGFYSAEQSRRCRAEESLASMTVYKNIANDERAKLKEMRLKTLKRLEYVVSVSKEAQTEAQPFNSLATRLQRIAEDAIEEEFRFTKKEGI